MSGEPLFGLTAVGASWLEGGRFVEWNCKYLFRSREEAVAEIPAFIDRLCEPTDDNLDALKKGTVSVQVFEYELMEPARKC